MTAKTRNKAAVVAKEKKETPIVVYFMAVAGAIVGYLVLGKIILGAQPHPYHWVSGVLGGVLGYFLGWLWFRFKGDIL